VTDEKERVRTASYGCGKLKAEARGAPVDVYVCSCQSCQKKSGSAFTYAAIFPEASVSVTGERRSWRNHGESGQWIENNFCPTCGISVFFHGEGLPGLIGISAGCLSDRDFPKPNRLFWSSRRHRWLEFPADVPLVDTQ
jgi:hypothetical protein